MALAGVGWASFGRGFQRAVKMRVATSGLRKSNMGVVSRSVVQEGLLTKAQGYKIHARYIPQPSHD